MTKFIVGCILGDSHIAKPFANACIMFAQTALHSDYLFYQYSLFQDYCKSRQRLYQSYLKGSIRNDRAVQLNLRPSNVLGSDFKRPCSLLTY
jgi:hypothetical protein